MSINKITGFVSSVNQNNCTLHAKIGGEEKAREKPLRYCRNLSPAIGDKVLILADNDSLTVIGLL